MYNLMALVLEFHDLFQHEPQDLFFGFPGLWQTFAKSSKQLLDHMGTFTFLPGKP